LTIIDHGLSPMHFPKSPAVATDVLIFSVLEGKLCVLLIQIGSGPYKGKWALPGGLVEMKETLDEAALRILEEKAGVRGVYLEQLYTFGDVDRDVRGRSVSVAYFALVNGDHYNPRTTDYYAGIGWKDVRRLPAMAFDHKKVVEFGVKRLASKLAYSNIAYALLPREFTLSDLQSVYEVILGRTLDKRNFRKKIQEVKLVKETGSMRRTGANRPAKLYAFSQSRPTLVDVL